MRGKGMVSRMWGMPAIQAVVRSMPRPKPPWRTRKEQYLAHLADVHSDALLISLADKVHNATAILRDLQVHGELLWSRFAGARDGSLWYYRSLHEIYRSRQAVLPASLLEQFDVVVTEIEKMASSSRFDD